MTVVTAITNILVLTVQETQRHPSFRGMTKILGAIDGIVYPGPIAVSAIAASPKRMSGYISVTNAIVADVDVVIDDQVRRRRANVAILTIYHKIGVPASGDHPGG